MGTSDKSENSITPQIPFFLTSVEAGFPSPADDYIEKTLDLNELLITHPAATFFVRVQGESMCDAQIHTGDILIVDRSIEAKNNVIIIAIYNGEFTVKRLRKDGKQLWLIAENPKYAPLEITEESDFQVWGVVTFIIHQAQ